MNDSKNPSDLTPNDENEQPRPTPGLDQLLRDHPNEQAGRELQYMKEEAASNDFIAGQQQQLLDHAQAVRTAMCRLSRRVLTVHSLL